MKNRRGSTAECNDTNTTRVMTRERFRPTTPYWKRMRYVGKGISHIMNTTICKKDEERSFYRDTYSRVPNKGSGEGRKVFKRGSSVKIFPWICRRDVDFNRSKSDKNMSRTGESNTTHSKNESCPTLADLKSQAKLLRQWHRTTINLSNLSRRNVSTNRITEISLEKAQNVVASDVKYQTATFVHAFLR